MSRTKDDDQTPNSGAVLHLCQQAQHAARGVVLCKWRAAFEMTDQEYGTTVDKLVKSRIDVCNW